MRTTNLDNLSYLIARQHKTTAIETVWFFSKGQILWSTKQKLTHLYIVGFCLHYYGNSTCVSGSPGHTYRKNEH
jgi:hypothetical protein